MRYLNIMRRVALFLLLLPLSMSLHAYDQFYYQGILFHATSSSTCEVIYPDWYGTYDGVINIPSHVNAMVYDAWSSTSTASGVSMVVTGIADEAFRECTGLTSVTIPNTVTYIGKNAFYGCTGLASISLPNSLDSIGTSAFSGCTGLTSVAIPNSVRYMGWNAFYGCSSLTSVTISRSVRELNGTFSGCTSLTSVEVPLSVISLDGAFTNCSNLSSVQMPSSLRYIGERTFDGCTSLAAIDIPNSVKNIGNKAFTGTALTSIELPGNLQSLGEYAFEGCNSLREISVRAIEPPVMGARNCFTDDIYNNATLFVPLSSTEIYTITDWWNLFAPAHVTGNSALDKPYDFTVNGIYYLITGPSTVCVTIGDNPYSGNVNIPTSTSYQGNTYSVTAIGDNAFDGCTSLTGVTIPNTVTHIGGNAFAGCTGLASITLPNSVTSIGDSAFNACVNITSLTVPEAVTYIGKDGLAGMTGLTSLTWNAVNCWTNGNLSTASLNNVTIGNNVELLPWNFIAGAPIASIQLPQSLTAISGSAFEGCQNLTSLTIPVNVTSIGPKAFYNCSSVTSLAWNARECWTNGDMPTPDITSATIGNEVKVLPGGFLLGSPITSIDIPISVETIGGSAFSDCTGLTSITIPDGVVNVGQMAFGGCTNVKTVTVGKGVELFSDDTFDRCAITTLNWNARNCSKNGGMYTEKIVQLTIGDEVETLPWGLAAYSKITHVELPNSLKNIGNENYPGYYDDCVGAFQGCTGLTSVVIPNSVTTIGNRAFSNCSNINHFDIPSSATAINYAAFWGCTGLTSFTCGENVETIGGSAFAHCSNLEEINFNDGLRSIGNWAFGYCWKLTSVDIPNSVTSMSGAFSDCGVSYLKLPDGLTEIGWYEFQNCRNLQTVIIGNGVQYIGSWAFSGSGITSIDIPDNVEEIHAYAFENCGCLESVTIGRGCIEMGRGAFESCDNLRVISVSEDNPVYDSRNNCNAVIETATNKLVHGCPGTTDVPRSVTVIGNFAFGYCMGITEITLPSRLKEIENDAFWYCPNLNTITCLAKTPPTVYSESFGSSSVNCFGATLYVRNESVEAYESATIWQNFSNIVGIDYTDPGDLDGNGELNISDVSELINLLINNTTVDDPLADVNGDGVVNISDIIELISFLLNEV